MPSQTGSIDLTSQVAANSNAISVAADDATTKANNAAKTATNYITADSNGIKIHMTDNSTTYQHQSATGTNFYVNNLKRSEVGGEGLKVYVGDTAGSETEIGHFGEYTRIGDIESSHTTISPLPNAGVAMYDETGSTRALRVATSGLYIGSDDTAHFSDDGFTLFPQGSDVGDVVRLNAGSIGTQRTNITRTIKLEANETLSTLSLSGAPTISNIYRNTTALVKGTDYIQQTTTNSGGVDWEDNATKDGHYINTNIIFNPAITGPASIIIECGVLVPQNYYMRMGPEWYNHTVIDDEGFRVINYNGDPVFNVDMASNGTSSVTVGESDKKHMILDADGLSAYDENGDYAEINGIVDGKNIKPNSVTANSINTENLVVGISQVENLSSSMAWQGICATAQATAAKVVTCKGFTLNSGATITVRFTTANTSTAALSLNVNSTGAKTIYVAGAATAAANQLLWAANATISFTYDGTYWRVTGEPRNWYGACTIAATTAAKTAAINEVVLCKGSTVNLQMTNANAVANPTLNITSLGAKDIYTANAKLTATDSNNWSADSTIPFVFDGQNFRYDSEASSKVNSIEIGGRNLLLWTGDLPKGTDTSTNGKDGIAAWGSANNLLSETEDGIKLTAAANIQECIGIPLANNGSIDNNEQVLLTFEARGNITSIGQFFWLQASGANISKNSWLNGSSSITLSETEWTKFTVDVTDSQANVRTCTRILLFYNLGSANSGKWVELRKKSVKLEKGNKATDWTPAPEDVAADISAAQTTANNATPKADAIKRTQRIYYRSNSATAPTTPGTASSNWVTKSDDGTGVWTKMHVAISSTHKYVYTCEQYQFANETVGYTTVLRDNTITVIDGGNIITGSVAANSINASSGTFDEANIPNLNASKITAGDISADRIKTNVISAINSLTAGQINAERINASSLAIGYSQLTDPPDIPDSLSDLENDSDFATIKQVNDNIALETTTLSDKLTDISADLYGTVTPDENGDLDESTRTPGIFATVSSVTDLSETVDGIGESVTEFNTTLSNRINDANADVTSIQEALYGTDDIDPIFARSEDVSTGYESLNNSMTTLQSSLQKDISDSVEEAETRLQNQYNKTQTDLEKLKGYVRVEIDSNQVPYLELGQVSDEVTAYKVTAHMTNSALDFRVSQEAEPVASIGSDNEGGLLKVTKANIGQLDIGENSAGHWEWQQRANGNLALKWIATQS